MARIVDNNRINTNPCAPEDNASNWQAQQTINNLFQTVIDEGGAGDTYKVKVNTSDTAPDYLHAKLYNVTATNFASTSDVLVVSYTQSNAQEKLFWRASDVPNYSGTGDLMLRLSGGAIGWSAYSGSVDNFTVKCNASDPTASYLHDAFTFVASYQSGADIPVGNETATGNDTERLFVDVSAIAGWNSTEFRLLSLSGNQTSWIAPSAFLPTNITISPGTYIDVGLSGTTWTISVDLTEVDSYNASAHQFLWNGTGNEKWQTIVGYDATKTQLLGHVSGTWYAKTIDEWLNLLNGHAPAADQSIGHDAGGSTMWQNDTSQCP